MAEHIPARGPFYALALIVLIVSALAMTRDIAVPIAVAVLVFAQIPALRPVAILLSKDAQIPPLREAPALREAAE